MRQQPKSRHLRYFRIACLFIGIIEATGALLWCWAGAGMYGSPLSSLLEMGSYKEVGFIVAIILAGPGFALWAGLTTRKLPCRAALMFCIGAAWSLILGARYQEMGLLIAAIVSLPMSVAAGFAFVLCKSEAAEETGTSSLDSASSKQRLFQFQLWHLMMLVTVLCVVSGLALAHANAARHRPPGCTPFLKKLKETQSVPGFVRKNKSALPSLVPIPAGSAYLSRLKFYGDHISHGNHGEMSVKAQFKLNQNFLPKEQRLASSQLIGRLKNEFEKQLIDEGSQILDIKVSKYESNSSFQDPPELQIRYRWRRIKGQLDARLDGPRSVEARNVEVEIEETPTPSLLRLSW